MGAASCQEVWNDINNIKYYFYANFKIKSGSIDFILCGIIFNLLVKIITLGVIFCSICDSKVLIIWFSMHRGQRQTK